MKQLQFEWYVLNENLNRNREIVPYNIFNNIRVNERTNELCVKYKRDKMTFEDFTEELRRIIQWQEWSRCEYEIAVRSMFGDDDNWKKIDCYAQALPNIKIIAKYVLEEYYPRLKVSLGTKECEETLTKFVKGIYL